MHRPPFDFNNTPRAYTWLRDQKDIKTALELPVVDPLDYRSTEYMTAQLVHGKKLVNTKEPGAFRLTNVLGSQDNETIDWAYQRGAAVVILHSKHCAPVSWGSVVMNDTTAGICIYRLDRPITHDSLFALFKDGFIPSPNSTSPDSVVMESSEGSFAVTDKNFASKQQGSSRFKARLTGGESTKAGGVWKILQGEKVVSEGAIASPTSYIDAIVSNGQKVTIQIELSSHHRIQQEFVIENATVTGL
jgi:hypothetical protein